MLVINVVIGIGIGLGYAAMPTLIMRAVLVSESGAANGLNTLMRALGASIASAVAAVLANSAVSSGGGSVPSESGFALALLFGLAVAVLCAVLALFIPKPRTVAEEEPAFPEGVLPHDKATPQTDLLRTQ